MNCTRCNDTQYVLVKESGISDYTRCIKNDTSNPNLDCGPNCAICNSITGICMECNPGYQPWFDESIILPQSKYICRLPCGEGCVNCNEATRSCAQCDEARNYTLYQRDYGTKTYRCQDITNMCDPQCVNCDRRGLNNNPPVLTGNCLACMIGFYVTGEAKCQQCPALCSTCEKLTGSCSACTNIKYTLYKDNAKNVNFCTDKVCHSACISCDIEGGMNSLNKRPNCNKCIQGYYKTDDQNC